MLSIDTMKLLIQITLLNITAITLVFTYSFYRYHSLADIDNSSLLRTAVSLKDTFTQDSCKKPKQRIAIISSFVGIWTQITEKDLDKLINKACYASLWDYDFIFNTTYGFDKQIDVGAWWLEYGSWNRVPHILDRLSEYDWILYADIDYIINDMGRPIESFFNEWHLYGKHPSIFVPKDLLDGTKPFSDFAVLIKNDAFGRRVVENWMSAAKGLCPKGNFASEKREYTWEDSDQPGLWYALVQTYKEFFPHESSSDRMYTKPLCNSTTGIVDTEYAYAHEIDSILGSYVLGSGGSDLLNIPNNQPIIWSLPNNESDGGLGWQFKWGDNPRDQIRHSFAFHLDLIEEWNPHARETLDVCKNIHRCYANFTKNGIFQIGCGDLVFVRSSIHTTLQNKTIL